MTVRTSVGVHHRTTPAFFDRKPPPSEEIQVVQLPAVLRRESLYFPIQGISLLASSANAGGASSKVGSGGGGTTPPAQPAKAETTYTPPAVEPQGYMYQQPAPPSRAAPAASSAMSSSPGMLGGQPADGRADASFHSMSSADRISTKQVQAERREWLESLVNKSPEAHPRDPATSGSAAPERAPLSPPQKLEVSRFASYTEGP